MISRKTYPQRKEVEVAQAYETKAWLKHYAPWTPHELDYSDTTIASLSLIHI